VVDYRAIFDADVTFRDGGCLQVQNSPGWTCPVRERPRSRWPRCSYAICLLLVDQARPSGSWVVRAALWLPGRPRPDGHDRHRRGAALSD
jgi:hypothetical protein